MGANFDPDNANLFMGYLEQHHIHTDNPFSDNILLYRRYIDDLFLVWRGTETHLHEFHDYLNGLIGSIKFSLKFDCTRIHFLDTWVVQDTHILHTILYKKPTDMNS